MATDDDNDFALRADAPAFIPRSLRPCRDFQFGTCGFGHNCRYLHQAPAIDSTNGLTPAEEEELSGEIAKLQVAKDGAPKVDEDISGSRVYGGAIVTFGLGAAVTLIKLQAASKFGKWLQVSSVACSWFKPARMAFLTYNDPAALGEAADTLLTTLTPSGHSLACSFKPPRPTDPPNRFTLEVRNLDANCSTYWLENILVGIEALLKIKLRDPMYELSNDESKETVETLLRSIGPLASSHFYNDPRRIKLNLTGSFLDPTNVTKAVEELNKCVDDIGKLSVKPLVSVKFNVPIKIVEALRADLDKLKKQSRLEHRVQLKVPPSNTTSKTHLSLRISAAGADAPKIVAKIKVELEKLLAGTIVMNDAVPLWHSFFATSAALPYLKGISFANHLYLHRDLRKSQLVCYGGVTTARDAAQRVLMAKVTQLKHLPQTIILTTDQFKSMMTGRFTILKSTFGDKVILDVASTPKKIVLQGSKKDLHHAKSILEGEEDIPEKGASPPRSPPKSPGTCGVCWTEATNPLRMQCGHTYCTECFLHQVESVRDHDIPLRCCGNEGKCTHLFSIEELQKLLPFATFEALLELSFKIYIRTHPAEYQFCATPDCPSVYRINTNEFNNAEESTIFFCSTCLANICTRCKSVAHEGMTCAEYQDSLNTEAMQTFKLENNIKDCPRCRSSMEKTGGCNHVVCPGCTIDVCWVCLQTFGDSDDCYTHLRNVHGGLGVDPEDDYEVLSDQEVGL